MDAHPTPVSPEHARLRDAERGLWRRWGPYLAERQWGTVREDYSADGNAWEYFPHEQARSRVYRWGEDGLAGFCDDQQRLCLALALWNGADPILKERLFGLSNPEGNHGEDVKELYYFLDGLPSHAYMKMLYKYPQRAFPYARLVDENRRRSREEPEFELLDTGIFEEDRYFDVTVEYAKGAPEDILMRITVHNRGPEPAPIHVLPQIWFRNTWGWKGDPPEASLLATSQGCVEARHPTLGAMHIWTGDCERLFCDNETNAPLLFGVPKGGSFKDAFHACLIEGDASALNADLRGTKMAAHHVLDVPAGESRTVRMRLSREERERPFGDFDGIVKLRSEECEAFYAQLQAGISCPDARRIQRQALAGLLWSKQFYSFDIPQWIAGDPAYPPPPKGRMRNREWMHLNNAEVLSMPDTWEYPWYAAWDLAFHCLPLAMVDPELAKAQLVLLTREWYMHPSGQLPAYEWAFGDANPPVHAWAAWRVFQMDRKQQRKGDLPFLERIFHKLLLNFTWWVNRKDAEGNNVFQGGFLGLDNIGVFDRSAPLDVGDHVNQADGTAWMAMFSLNMMRIALELALHNHVYEDIATKFFEHFLYIAKAMTSMGHGGVGLWDEEDTFFYDVLSVDAGRQIPLKVRSMVGLIPLFAVETLEPDLLAQLPDFTRRMEWFLEYRPDLAGLVSRWKEPGLGDRHLLSLLRGHRMKCLLRRMLDEEEYLSPFGVRSLSRHHLEHPYRFTDEQAEHMFTVQYRPGESDSGLFGGNSNWRGPVWFPVNYLVIESLQKFHHYYGDGFLVECPKGSGRMLSLNGIADELRSRLASLFLKDETGRRAFFGDDNRCQKDSAFRDHLLFHEYFDGDTGQGRGASHQTGWTALIAKILQPRPARQG